MKIIILEGMATTSDKINEIEAEMARTQKNKATAHHMGLLKAKLARLKRELIDGGAKGKGGAKEEGFDVAKTGDCRIGLVGFPSVGKSTLMTKLTGTFSLAADYEFTTLTCVPGVFNYKGAKFQLLDLPGIIEGAKDNKGKGRQVIGVARTCSLILIVLDATRPLMHKKIIESELEGFGLRLNKQPPKITISKRDKGGLAIIHNVPQTKMDDDLIRAISKEYRLMNADVYLNCDATEDDFIDVIEGNRKYVPCIYVLNKIDQISFEELEVLDKIPHYVPIAGMLGWNFDELLESIWEYQDLIRIYTKPKGQVPDYDAPVILTRKTCTVRDFCLKIHKSLLHDFKFAQVWGRSVKFSPQKVGLDHQLMDEDIVQILKK